MKESYLTNFFIYQLETTDPINVFKQSLNKVFSYDLLKKIIQKIRVEDFETFLTILQSSVYDINRLDPSYILSKYPLTQNSYNLLKNANLSIDRDTDIVSSLYTFPKPFLLNYCLVRECLDNVNYFEVFQSVNLSTDFSSTALKDDFGMSVYFNFLCKMTLNAYLGKINEINYKSLTGICHEDDIISYLKRYLKDPLLKAILDSNARVNALSYGLDHLFLVYPNQIYNLDTKNMLLLSLCYNNSNKGICACCGRILKSETIIFHRNLPKNDSNFNTNSQTNVTSDYNENTKYEYTDITSDNYANRNDKRNNTGNVNNEIRDFNSQSNFTNLGSQRRNGANSSQKESDFDTLFNKFGSNEYKIVAMKLLENSLLEEEYALLYKILLHCPFLRFSRYVKVFLKLFISLKASAISPAPSEFQSLSFIDHPMNGYSPACYILNTLALFEMNDENETVVISFFKASSTYLKKALMAIPVFMKTKKMYFSCFVVLLEAYQENEFTKLLVRNIVYRFRSCFMSIFDLILEYYSKFYCLNNEKLDFEFLNQNFELLANLFSDVPEKFVQKNFYHIFNAMYPNENFTQNLIQQNIKYLVIQKIIENSFTEQVEDVDILVGLLFRNRFEDLDNFFKPSVGFFIKKNISHILFKIKSSYLSNIYHRNTCIYKVLGFIISYININLYFSYIWPYTEFFLNREYCECASYFLERLSSNANFKVLTPYLMRPFSCIEDLEIFPNIETKIYAILARYFYYCNNGKVPMEYSFHKCPFVTYDLTSKNDTSNIKKQISDKDTASTPAIFNNNCDSISNMLDLKHHRLDPCDTAINGLRANGSVIQNEKLISSSTNAFLRSLNSKAVSYCRHLSVMKSVIESGPYLSFTVPCAVYEVKDDRNEGYSNQSVYSIYLSLRELVIDYCPQYLINDEIFIENFLLNYQQSKSFKSKIQKIYPGLPVDCKALFGNIKSEIKAEVYLKGPDDIPKAILTNCLLKINYEKQDLFAFTIQEFLKNIQTQFDPEIENFIQQFRHTKFEYKFTLKEPGNLDLSSYRLFLESLFLILYHQIKKYSFLKYLFLFDNSTLEYATFCLIKIAATETSIDVVSILSNIHTSNVEILRFLLKINAFADRKIISKEQAINFSILAKDYYSLIYYLEDETTNKELLQLSYFMVNDFIRTKGFNSVSMSKSYSTINMFFDFLLNKNYKAAASCLIEMVKDDKIFANYVKKEGFFTEKMKDITVEPLVETSKRKCILDAKNNDNKIDCSSSRSGINVPMSKAKEFISAANNSSKVEKHISSKSLLINQPVELKGRFSIYNISNESYGNIKSKFGNLSINLSSNPLVKVLKEIVECNPDDEIELLINGKDSRYSGVFYHIFKDLELLSRSINHEKTAQIIQERRKIAEHADLILKIHKFFLSQIDIDAFSEMTDKDVIKMHIEKKEYQKAEEEIAKYLLKNDLSVLQNLVDIKINLKLFDEAKEVLKRIISSSIHSSVDFFRSTVKLCEISPSKSLFESSVTELETTFNSLINLDNSECATTFKSQMATLKPKSGNKLAILKLEDIYKKLKQYDSSCGSTQFSTNTKTSNSTVAEASNKGNVSVNQKLGTNLESTRSIDGLKAFNQNESSGAKNLSFTQSNINDLINDKSSNQDGFSTIVTLYEQLQRLYFLTAKYFEKHDIIISIKYYFKSFTSNDEAIPRFFHLISSTNRFQAKIVNEMIDIIIKEYLSCLIPFYNQISTKIAIESDSVKFYKKVVAAMLEQYPYQTHWNSLFLYNSTKQDVSKIMNEIVKGLTLSKRRLFLDINNCSEKLSSIAKYSSQNLSMDAFPEVKALFPANINIPGQMTEINNIKNEILVFRSLQMPKKITFVGEDGVDYPMIVKFKDDLRKDSRFMDLDVLLNKIFDDGYYIRRYNVVPFNHESGIIEFIPNLANLKGIISKYYKNINEGIQKFLKTKIIGGNNMMAMMNQYKPVYLDYLKNSYSDPYVFYQNRNNYIKTNAIMNIVGWYIGLGDRHAENIHFDVTNGDTVHVDLNCIFEKGKNLEIPEKVPFRLTQNIIDGFGVLGIEGTFIHTMKYTLEVLKDNRDVIQANLLSFVFDPLFEWSKRKTEPTKILESLDKKLDFEDCNYKVDELINEATDLNNLGSMYIGWMSFL